MCVPLGPGHPYPVKEAQMLLPLIRREKNVSLSAGFLHISKTAVVFSLGVLKQSKSGTRSQTKRVKINLATYTYQYYNAGILLEFQGTFPVNEQLNEFDCYRSYRATDYGQSYFKVTKNIVPFLVPVFCFQLFPNLFLLYTNPPNQEPKNCSEFEGF